MAVRAGSLLRPLLLASLVATSVACTAVDAQGTRTAAASTYVPPKTADGIPDLQGIWQAVDPAYVNLEAHSASSDGPAGRSVVEGGTIPYLESALKTRQENFANRAKLDGEKNCY